MKSVFFIIFCLVLGLSLVSAQQAPRNITLDAAIQIALERNLLVIQQQNTFDAQQSRVTAAYGGLLPSIGANGSWNRSQINKFGPLIINNNPVILNGQVVMQNFSSTSNYFQAGIGANMTIFDGFANTSTVSQATSNAVAAEQDLYRTKQNTVYQAEAYYLTVLRNDALMKTAEDNLKRDQRQLDQITEMNKLGAKAIADVYRQRVQVGNDELNLIQAKNNLEKSKADLVLFLGLSISDEFDFSDPMIKPDIDTTEFAAINTQYSDFASMTQQALTTRPDYQSAVEALSAAGSSITMARSGYFPTVTASLNYGLSSQEINTMKDNKSLGWGVGIQIPLFNGFQRESQMQQAQAGYRTAEVALAQTERSVQVDVKKALLDLDAAQKAVTVSQENVLSADEDRKIQEEKYRLGASTLLDLLTANANYTTALSNKINAVYNYILAKKNVEVAIGTVKY